MPSGLLVAVSLVLGPLETAPETISARLCNGGSIEIPIEREPQPDEPCALKACHSASCRKRFDLAQ